MGQGDATLIDCGETEVLIDGGTNSAGKDVVAAIAPYIDGKLDYVIATHPDADHVGRPGRRAGRPLRWAR